LLKIKYTDIEIDTNDVKFWTKDQTYNVRHKIESAQDLYRGAIVEVTTGSEQKRKREEDKEDCASKRPRVTGPRFILRLRGLPWRTTQKQIKDFFEGLELVRAQILYLQNGRASGDGLVEFKSEEDLEQGKLKDKERIGERYIEVFKATAEEMDRALGVGETSVIKNSNNKVLRMRGLPYTAIESDVIDFFKVGDLTPARVHIVTDLGNGRALGIALVEFETEEEIVAAMDLNRNEIGDRYIELFRASMGELKGALGLETSSAISALGSGRGNSWDKGYGEGAYIKMRGLPFNTTEVQINNFFHQVNINPLKIHRKPDGSEAFVEFYSSDIPKAMTRQKGYMGHRYVELFRVSYDEVADIVGLPTRTRYNYNRSTYY